MTLYRLDASEPQISPNAAFIAEDAQLIGNILVAEDASIWFGAVLRGDNERIAVGARSNIQDLCVLHTDPGFPLTIGTQCTVGHCAILHGCTIGDNTLIGMGAIVLNGAKIGSNCLVAAGTLVTEGMVIPDNTLVMGAPAKTQKPLDEQATQNLTTSALRYVENGRRFAKSLVAYS